MAWPPSNSRKMNWRINLSGLRGFIIFSSFRVGLANWLKPAAMPSRMSFAWKGDAADATIRTFTRKSGFVIFDCSAFTVSSSTTCSCFFSAFSSFVFGLNTWSASENDLRRSLWNAFLKVSPFFIRSIACWTSFFVPAGAGCITTCIAAPSPISLIFASAPRTDSNGSMPSSAYVRIGRP